MFIRFYAEPLAVNSTFEILFTAYRERKDSPCADDEYDCEDAKCISHELRCNGRINCQFRWDEDGCGGGPIVGQSEHITIIIVVFGLILGGMMVTFLINCLRKIARDQKLIREHIRQSRESEIDAVGRGEFKKSMESINRVKDRAAKAAELNEAHMYQRQESGRSRGGGGNGGDEDEFLQRNEQQQQFGQPEQDIELVSRGRQVHPIERESKMCETAVQTRESLFQNVHIIQPPSEIHTPEARLSSFGKPHPPQPFTLKPLHGGADTLRQHTTHHYDTRPPHADRYASTYSQQDSERKSAPDVIIMTSVQR